MIINRNRLFLLAIIFSFALFIAACAPSDESDAGDGEGEGESKEEGGDLIIGQTGEPDTLNPLYSTSSSSLDGFRHIFGTLVRFDEEGTAEGYLAEDWELSDDGLVLTFNLRDDITWHDGEPFTAEDVEFTFNLVKEEDYTGQRASIAANFEKIEALDEHTVQFTMDEPNYTILRRENPYFILPKHILEDVPVADLEDHDFNRNPVGLGPFKFKEWNSGQHMVLEGNDDYFEGATKLDTLTFKFIPDSNNLMAQFKAGDVDYIGVSSDDLSSAEQLVDEGVAEIFEAPGRVLNLIAYNTRIPLLEDNKVRQALTLAIDRQSIIDNILDGKGGPLYIPVLPIHWAHTDDVEKFEYDVERSQELLAEAGWEEKNSDGYLEKDGEEFEFEMMVNQGNSVAKRTAEVIQSDWKEVGVNVNIKILESSARLEAASGPEFEFDSYLGVVTRASDPSLTSLYHTDQIENGLNRVGFSNAEADEIMVESDGLIDEGERSELLHEVYDIIADEQAHSLLYYPLNQTLYSTDIEDIEFKIGVTHHNIHKWWMNR